MPNAWLDFVSKNKTNKKYSGLSYKELLKTLAPIYRKKTGKGTPKKKEKKPNLLKSDMKQRLREIEKENKELKSKRKKTEEKHDDVVNQSSLLRQSAEPIDIKRLPKTKTVKFTKPKAKTVKFKKPEKETVGQKRDKKLVEASKLITVPDESPKKQSPKKRKKAIDRSKEIEDRRQEILAKTKLIQSRKKTPKKQSPKKEPKKQSPKKEPKKQSPKKD